MRRVLLPIFSFAGASRADFGEEQLGGEIEGFQMSGDRSAYFFGGAVRIQKDQHGGSGPA